MKGISWNESEDLTMPLFGIFTGTDIFQTITYAYNFQNLKVRFPKTFSPHWRLHDHQDRFGTGLKLEVFKYGSW